MKNRKILWPLMVFSIMCVLDTAISAGEEIKPLPPVERALSLEECIGLAIQNSFEVKLARLDFLIEKEEMGITESVFDTDLSLTIDYEKDKRQTLSVFGASDKQTNTYEALASKTLPSGTEFTMSLSDTRTWSDSVYVSPNPAHEAEAGLEIRQPVAKNFFGYNDRRDVTLTRLAIKNADLDRKERIEALIAEVQKAYWEWVFSKKSLEIYCSILDRAKKLHKANFRNFNTGLIEKGDFLASKANVLMRESDLLLAENKLRRAQENIKLLMNINADYRIYPTKTLEYRKIDLNLGDCLNTAFKMRRDYQKARREIERKNISLETKENRRWPEIDLVASMTLNGIDREFSEARKEITNENTPKYYAGLEVSIPIENSSAKSEFKKALHNKEKAIIALKDIERTIITDIGNAFRDYITYGANVGKIMEAARLQHEKLVEEEKRFKYGRSNTKRLIDFQQDYLRAELQVSQSILDLEKARINLEKELNIVLEAYKGLL